MSFSSYSVDNDKKFARAIAQAVKQTNDLQIPLIEIAKDWFKSNKAIFMLKGSGQYPDLKEKTKRHKLENFGFIYPILKATGRLEKSLLEPENKESIHQILNKNTIALGTSVPYASFHQEGGKIIPTRKMVFIGPESVFSARNEISGRLERWTQILKNHIISSARPISK